MERISDYPDNYPRTKHWDLFHNSSHFEHWQSADLLHHSISAAQTWLSFRHGVLRLPTYFGVEWFVGLIQIQCSPFDGS